MIWFTWNVKTRKNIIREWCDHDEISIHTKIPFTLHWLSMAHQTYTNMHRTTFIVYLEYKTIHETIPSTVNIVHHVPCSLRFVGLNKMINHFPYFIRVCTHNFLHRSSSIQQQKSWHGFDLHLGGNFLNWGSKINTHKVELKRG